MVSLCFLKSPGVLQEFLGLFRSFREFSGDGVSRSLLSFKEFHGLYGMLWSLLTFLGGLRCFSSFSGAFESLHQLSGAFGKFRSFLVVFLSFVGFKGVIGSSTWSHCVFWSLQEFSG